MAQQHQHEHNEHHVVPFQSLTRVCVALLVLTVLTVVTAKFVHLGVMATPVAFLIALVKALLVMAVFMGLKYDAKSNRYIFASGFFFLLLLFFFCALDIWTRIAQGNSL